MNIKNWQKFVIIFCSILGTLLHFTYDWSGENVFFSLFSAVNESTWEHLKLAFYPMFIMAIVGNFVIKKDVKNYWFSQIIGIMIAICFLIVFFYTYEGIIGRDVAIINIISFYISIILGEFVAYKIMFLDCDFHYEKLSIIILIFLVICFSVFTFAPPRIGLFKDPISGEYGIKK